MSHTNEKFTFEKRVGDNISHIMSTKNINQREVLRRCKKAGYNISSGTLSEAKNGKANLTLQNLQAIAYGLEVEVIELIDVPFSLESSSAMVKETQKFNPEIMITNPYSVFFKPYLGDFQVLFFKTENADQEDSMVKGIMHFEPSKDGTYCEAILKVQVEETDTTTNHKIKRDKIYIGSLVISTAMRAIYCYLKNEEIGEMCMLIFQQIYTSLHPVETIMAAAITTASGVKRRPTMHRICLSRKEVKSDVLECVRGQLRMNTSDIFITEEQLKKAMSDYKIFSKEFIRTLKKVEQSCHCYCIPEEVLYNSSLDKNELYKYISLLRSMSIAPKYNKIAYLTDEILYSLMREEN